MDKTLEKKNYYNSLYGYYYTLLTTKQQEIFEAYYSEDYSLSEISEDLKISRNAVWDSLQKTIQILDEYENKLKLHQKDETINQFLDELKQYTSNEGLEIIKKIKEME